MKSFPMFSSICRFGLCHAALALIGTSCMLSECLGAYPTAVNTTLPEPISQTNVQLGSLVSPATIASIYQTSAQAVAGSYSAAILPQQSTLILQSSAASTLGVTTIYSIDTASSGIAAKTLPGTTAARFSALSALTLPPEGILQGMSLLMFNIEGLSAPYADYYVVGDQGYDYYIDHDGNLILTAHNIRTIGNAPSSVTDLGLLLPQASVAQYFPQLSETSSASARSMTSSVDEQLRDIYFGLRYADGSTTFYEASLGLPYAVPEVSTLTMVSLAGLGLSAVTFARRRAIKK